MSNILRNLQDVKEEIEKPGYELTDAPYKRWAAIIGLAAERLRELVYAPPDGETDFDGSVARLLALHGQKAAMEQEYKPLCAEYDALKKRLAAEFAERDMKGLKIGDRNLVVSMQVGVSVRDSGALARALLDSGNPDYLSLLKAQPQSFAAWVRERLYNEELDAVLVQADQLPEDIRPHVALSEYPQLSIRKG